MKKLLTIIALILTISGFSQQRSASYEYLNVTKDFYSGTKNLIYPNPYHPGEFYYNNMTDPTNDLAGVNRRYLRLNYAPIWDTIFRGGDTIIMQPPFSLYNTYTLDSLFSGDPIYFPPAPPYLSINSTSDSILVSYLNELSFKLRYDSIWVNGDSVWAPIDSGKILINLGDHIGWRTPDQVKIDSFFFDSWKLPGDSTNVHDSIFYGKWIKNDTLKIAFPVDSLFDQSVLKWLKPGDTISSHRDSVFSTVLHSDTIFSQTSHLDTIFNHIFHSDTIFSNTVRTDSIFSQVSRLDTIYSKISRIDTIYNQIFHTDTIYSIVSHLDTIYNNSFHSDTIYSVISHLDTIFSNIIHTDTIFSQISHLDTIYSNIFHSHTFYSQISRIDTIYSVVSHLDTIFNNIFHSDTIYSTTIRVDSIYINNETTPLKDEKVKMINESTWGLSGAGYLDDKDFTIRNHSGKNYFKAISDSITINHTTLKNGDSLTTPDEKVKLINPGTGTKSEAAYLSTNDFDVVGGYGGYYLSLISKPDSIFSVNTNKWILPGDTIPEIETGVNWWYHQNDTGNGFIGLHYFDGYVAIGYLPSYSYTSSFYSTALTDTSYSGVFVDGLGIKTDSLTATEQITTPKLKVGSSEVTGFGTMATMNFWSGTQAEWTANTPKNGIYPKDTNTLWLIKN
jgi:hypothetical protein